MVKESGEKTYVVAVSGGVDSVVLLDLLVKQSHESRAMSQEGSHKQIPSLNTITYNLQPNTYLFVAHFDHGIREESSADRVFVQQLAEKYGLTFEYAEGKLGKNASEDAARHARYEFLQSAAVKHDADAIITAHHQDDVLETAIINLIRGTNRRGITALSSSERIVRPLLLWSKQDILAYAEKHDLSWREDASNNDLRYLRNHVRHKVVNKMTDAQRQQLLSLVNDLHDKNQEIDSELEQYIHTDPASPGLNRNRYIMLPHDVAREVMAMWLRHAGMLSYDANMLDRLAIGAKTLSVGARMNVGKSLWLEICGKTLALTPADR